MALVSDLTAKATWQAGHRIVLPRKCSPNRRRFEHPGQLTSIEFTALFQTEFSRPGRRSYFPWPHIAATDDSGMRSAMASAKAQATNNKNGGMIRGQIQSIVIPA